MPKRKSVELQLVPTAVPGPSRPAKALDNLVGRRIKAHRLAMGITVTAVATALGVTRRQVDKYESGINRISAEQVAAISDLLDVEMSAFFEPDAGDANAQADIPSDRGAGKPRTRLIAAFNRIAARSDQMLLIEMAERLASTGQPAPERRSKT